MKAAVQITFSGLKDIWEDIWTVLVCNLLWILSNLLIIPGPPATLALFYYGNRLAHGEAADVGDYWQAFRRYWGPGWRWGVVNLVVMGILIGDFILTGQSNLSQSGQLGRSFYLAALAGWLVVQFFALPFLFEQQDLSVRQALRNGLLLITRNPVFSISLVGLLGLVLVLGFVLFMLSIAFGGVLLACIANRAVINRLETNH
jgi:uncharacterized membrane protein YesL